MSELSRITYMDWRGEPEWTKVDPKAFDRAPPKPPPAAKPITLDERIARHLAKTGAELPKED